MSQFRKTRVRLKLMPEKPDLDAGIKCVSQEAGLKFKSAVGFQYEVALFEANEQNLYNVGNITSVTHVIYTKAKWDANQFDAPYLTTVFEGPFTDFDASKWTDGSAQHFTIGFTATQTNLTPGDYIVVFYGNTDDPLSPTDFAVAAKLTVLASGIPTAFRDPDTQDELLAALKKEIAAQLGDYALKRGKKGDTLTLVTKDPNAGGQFGYVTLEAVMDPDKGLILSEQKEII